MTIDFDSDGVPKHIGQISKYMSEWEGTIADGLGLTPADVADIKEKYPSKPKLQMYGTKE